MGEVSMSVTSCSVIGTCSICGGPVMVPSVWMGIYPPIPECAHCGATSANYGPTIPMTPSRQPKNDDGTEPSVTWIQPYRSSTCCSVSPKPVNPGTTFETSGNLNLAE